MPEQESSVQKQGIVIILLLMVLAGIFAYFLNNLSVAQFVTVLMIVSPVFFLISFFSIQTGLIFVLLSMLLSPEIPIGSVGGVRSVIIRMEDLLIPILLLAWIARLAIRKEFKLFVFSPLNTPILVLFVLSVVSTFNGAFHGWVASPMMATFYILKTLEFFLIFFFVLNYVRTEESIRRFLFFALLTALVVGIYALIQVPHVEIFSSHRITAPFEGNPEPATMGGYLAFLLLMVFSLFLYEKKLFRKWLYGTLGLILFVPFLYTLNRSSYLAFFVGMIFIAFVEKRKWLTFLIFAGLVLSPLILPSAVKDRIAFTWLDATNPGREIGVDQSFQERVYSFRRAWNNVKQSNVLIGLGISTMPYPDNQYARTLHEIGFLGLAVWLWIYLRFYRVGQWLFNNVEDGTMKGLTLGYQASILGLLLHAFGTITFYTVRIMEPFCFISGLVVSLYLIKCQELTANPQ